MAPSLRGALALTPLLAFTTVPLRAQDAPSLAWRTDLDAARAEALRDDKPLLAVFRCEP